MDKISSLLGALRLDGGPRARPAQHFDFLDLPGEVRNLIYRATLTTDPPRLEREHRYSCDWCTWDPDEPQNRMVGRDGETLPGCDRCWARRGPALLLANRKIYGEAAHIFWAENQFSFRGVDSFIHLVGNALRPEYRRMLTHVTIYRDPRLRFDGPRFDGPGRGEAMHIPPLAFWDVLFECKGLRALEMPPYFRGEVIMEPTEANIRLLHAEWDAWPRLRDELPSLETFSWSFFGSYLAQTPPGFIPREFEFPVRVTKCLPLAAFSREQFCRYGPFDRLDREFGEELYRMGFSLGPDVPGLMWLMEVPCTGRPRGYRRAAAIVRGDNTLETTHPGAIPTTWTVEFPLLPLTAVAIARNAMRRRMDEDAKKAEREARSA